MTVQALLIRESFLKVLQTCSLLCVSIAEDAFARDEVPMGAMDSITAFAEQEGRICDSDVARLIYPNKYWGF